MLQEGHSPPKRHARTHARTHRQALPNLAELEALAAVEGDGLGVLPHAHEGVAEEGFALCFVFWGGGEGRWGGGFGEGL